MNEKLKPEVRVKVAAELFPHHEWFVKAEGVFTKAGWGSFIVFDPTYYPQQKDALTRTAARLGHEAKEPVYSMAKTRLMEALATNDVNALELLVAELRGLV